MKINTKNSQIRFIIILFFVFLVVFIFIFFYNNQLKNRNFKNNIECSKLGDNYIYNEDLNKCTKLNNDSINTQKKKDLCMFAIYDIEIDYKFIKGPNPDKIKILDQRCNENDGMIGRWNCIALDREKNNKEEIIEFDIKGNIETLSKQYLEKVGIKLFAFIPEKKLIGTSFQDIEKQVVTGSVTPFEMKIYADLNIDDKSIDEYLEGREVHVYPFYSNCN